VNPIAFLLNRNTTDSQDVQAPAFSLTKVMALVVPVMTLLCGYIAHWIKDTTFSSGQVAALIIAVVAFLAITSSADVIARSRASAASASSAGVVLLPHPASGTVVQPGADQAVTVLALRIDGPTRFWCLAPDGSTSWESADDVLFATRQA
jgi:hypothetical protein